MQHIGHEMAHAFIHADRGFFHLMIELFRKPGEVIRAYIIESKRKRYFPPIQYLLIIGAIATFVVVNTHFMESSMQAVGMEAHNGNDKQARIMQKVNEFQSRYYNFSILLQLPFFSLATFWIYKKYRLNYAEHLTLHTFIAAQITLITTVLMLLMFAPWLSDNVLFRNTIFLLILIISVAYQAGVCMQFFKEKTIRGLFKALGAYLLGLLIYFVTIVMLSFGVGLIYSKFFR
ncbi:MAG: DUF3667 domain-containing protein [Chitinophagaceae bacterium]|nr:DUF3667 domain-containing protein [Chitinophagaceae bacterium]